MTDDQIKHIVTRFLSWKLPDTFNPDGGISFKREFNENTPYPMKHEPSGTNLFDSAQAEAMVRHMLADLPAVKGHDLTEFRKFVDLIEGRAMACDGPVTPFLEQLNAASDAEKQRFVGILSALYREA